MRDLFRPSFATHARRVAIWNAAAPIPGCDKSVWRCDDQGRVIRWADYRDWRSSYGWTICETRGPGWLAVALGVRVAKPMHWRSDEAVRRARGLGAFGRSGRKLTTADGMSRFHDFMTTTLDIFRAAM